MSFYLTPIEVHTIMNNVQFERRSFLNTVITSKEHILDVSRRLIQEQGWAAISIRSVASACGVSVGSIYNYFDSKSDLAAETIESIWQDIFHFPEQQPGFNSFPDCVQWIFDRMKQGNEKYPGFFTLHSMSFVEEEKSNGRRLMNQSWNHIRTVLCTFLINDPQVRPEAFHEGFTPEGFSELIFSWILASLMQQNYDCRTILEVIRRSIY